jgi:hypothetical protein
MTGMTRCVFADFQNQVWGGNSPVERKNRTFGIDLAVSIIDGPNLPEKRRKELALARLMAETIGVILYTGESDSEISELRLQRTWLASSGTFTQRLQRFKAEPDRLCGLTASASAAFAS